MPLVGVIAMIKVKLANKAVPHFYRAGIKFTPQWQDIDETRLSKQQLVQLKNEPMLVVKPTPNKGANNKGAN